MSKKSKIFQTIGKIKSRRGVSSLELMVINVAVIGVLIVFLHPNGPFARAFHETLSSSAYEIFQMEQKMKLSISDPSGPGPSTSGVAFAVWYRQQGGYYGPEGPGGDPGQSASKTGSGGEPGTSSPGSSSPGSGGTGIQ